MNVVLVDDDEVDDVELELEPGPGVPHVALNAFGLFAEFSPSSRVTDPTTTTVFSVSDRRFAR